MTIFLLLALVMKQHCNGCYMRAVYFYFVDLYHACVYLFLIIRADHEFLRGREK
uniref:Uncharacterized protein n=1 Tax=Anguilla anguilla TaxID=7936 RepID=A0A0E9RQJ7_ANGAN